MEPELITTWRPRIISNEVSILTPSVETAAHFLFESRHDEEKWWGTYPSMSLNLISSAAAIEALESCEQSEFETDIRNSRLALTEYIREHNETFNLSELAACLRILARSERDDLFTLASSLISKLAKIRNGAGWGSPVPTVPETSDVLLAALSHRELASPLIDPTVQALFDEQNEDGGWSVVFGGWQSTPLASARAICALVSAQSDQNQRNFDNASLYLQGLVENGWLSLIEHRGDVLVAALVLRAAASLKSFPFESILQGVEAILGQRNADSAWGERKGGNSNVEATSACILALCTSGANRLITSRLALSAVNDAANALESVRKELEQSRNDVRSQVAKETKAILNENKRLDARVIELEKEKKILVRRIEDGETLIYQLSSANSDKFDIERGRYSLASGLGFWDTLPLAIRDVGFVPLLFGLIMIGVLVSLVLFFGSQFGYSLLLKYTGYTLTGLVTIILLSYLSRQSVRLLRERAVSDISARYNVKLGDIGTSDRKLILRRLPAFMSNWPASMRESFLHQLGRLHTLSPDSREAAARSIARQFTQSTREFDELRVLLSLLSNLPEDEQIDVLYQLRNVRGNLVAS